MYNHSLKPNLFIPGFAKCGTSALRYYLRQHKDIFEPKNIRGLAFEDIYSPPWISGSLEFRKLGIRYSEYIRQYSGATNYKYRIDYSQIYTFTDGIASYLKSFSAKPKILFMLREPKIRIISAYLYVHYIHKREFKEWLYNYFLPYLNSFLTYKRIIEYYKEFADNIRVINNNDIHSIPNIIMRCIFEYLELEPIEIKPLIANPSLPPSFDGLVKMYRIIKNILRPIKLDSVPLRLANSKLIYEFIYKNKHELYNKYIDEIPLNVKEILDKDYASTVEFITKNNLWIKS